MRYTALANHGGGPTVSDAPQRVIARATRAEAAGFDSISYGDGVVADPFLPLMLVAQHTTNPLIMTRVVGAFTRSPVHLASAAAWLDAASGGRFILGLGASLRRAAWRLGQDWDRPIVRMREVILLLRALWGEAVPGVERRPDGLFYEGKTIRLERSGADLVPQRRIPIYLAAAGPRMLKLAGALADGVVLELTTEAYVRWCVERIQEGAAEAGRDLTGFEVLSQGMVLPKQETTANLMPMGPRMGFVLRHIQDAEFFDTWERGGLGEAAAEIRATLEAGDVLKAEQLVRDTIYPATAVDANNPESFWAWTEGQKRAGVTTLALPLELEELFGLTLNDVRVRLD